MMKTTVLLCALFLLVVMAPDFNDAVAVNVEGVFGWSSGWW